MCLMMLNAKGGRGEAERERRTEEEHGSFKGVLRVGIPEKLISNQ